MRNIQIWLAVLVALLCYSSVCHACVPRGLYEPGIEINCSLNRNDLHYLCVGEEITVTFDASDRDFIGQGNEVFVDTPHLIAQSGCQVNGASASCTISFDSGGFYEWQISADDECQENNVDDPQATITLRFLVSEPDLTADSNNDGYVNGADEPVEETSPGMCLAYNDDDDNANNIPDREEPTNPGDPFFWDNDLKRVGLAYYPSWCDVAAGGEITVVAPSGAGAVRLWVEDSESPTGPPIPLQPQTYGICADSIPSRFYVEGYQPGEVELGLKYKPPDSTKECQDKIKFTVLDVNIVDPKGSADKEPVHLMSWINSPCYHFDFQGVTSGSPGCYPLDLKGEILPSTGFSYDWHMDTTLGTIANPTVAEPTHNPPAQPGEGFITLKAKYGTMNTGVQDKKKAIIYTDHLARDRANFGVGTSCGSLTGSSWTFTAFGRDITMPATWNCHGSVIHAYNGSGSGCSPTTVDWSVKCEVQEGQPLCGLQRGDVIAYFDNEGNLMHSQTVLTGTTTYGANNEPPPGGPATQSWRWAESEAGQWAANIPSQFKPIRIQVLDKP